MGRRSAPSLALKAPIRCLTCVSSRSKACTVDPCGRECASGANAPNLPSLPLEHGASTLPRRAPRARQHRRPAPAGAAPWHNVERDPVLAEAHRRGPGARPLLRLRAAQQRSRPPLRVAWDERYRDAGLTTLGVHSPRFSFTKRAELLAPALERLGVRHPVVDDSDYAALARLRLRGLAIAVSLGARAARWPGFTSARASTPRPRLAIAAELARIDSTLRARRADRAAARDRRPRRSSRPAERRNSSRRLGHRAMALRGRADRGGVRRRRCLRHGRGRRAGRVAGVDRRRAGPRDCRARRRPGRARRASSATSATRCSSRPIRSWRSTR